MNVTMDDVGRLAFEVRRFLLRGDLMTRLTGMGVLYLEFADVGSMHDAHAAIVLATSDVVRRLGEPAEEFIDDHTIALTPHAGIRIVLSCKRRFAVKSGGSVAYRDIAFNPIPPT